MVALVTATRDSSGMGIGAPVKAGLDELRELGSLALVLAAARPRGALPPPGPDRGLPEVVEPRAPAAAPRRRTSPSGSATLPPVT